MEETAKGRATKGSGGAKLVASGLTIVLLGAGLYLGWDAIKCEFKGETTCMSPADWGTFLSGIFAPAAFIWLCASVWIQSQELTAQREELRLTRLEFEENRKVMTEQAIEAKRSAEYIGKQTDILTRQEAEKTLRATIEGLPGLFARYRSAMSFVDSRGNRTIISGPRDMEGAQDSFDALRRLARSMDHRMGMHTQRHFADFTFDDPAGFKAIKMTIDACMKYSNTVGEHGEALIASVQLPLINETLLKIEDFMKPLQATSD